MDGPLYLDSFGLLDTSMTKGGVDIVIGGSGNTCRSGRLGLESSEVLNQGGIDIDILKEFIRFL